MLALDAVTNLSEVSYGARAPALQHGWLTMDFSARVMRYATELAEALQAHKNASMQLGEAARERMAPIEKFIEGVASETKKLVPQASIDSHRPEVDLAGKRVLFHYIVRGREEPEVWEFEVRGRGVHLMAKVRSSKRTVAMTVSPMLSAKRLLAISNPTEASGTTS
jgi:hypothetical protein